MRKKPTAAQTKYLMTAFERSGVAKDPSHHLYGYVATPYGPTRKVAENCIEANWLTSDLRITEEGAQAIGLTLQTSTKQDTSTSPEKGPDMTEVQNPPTTTTTDDTPIFTDLTTPAPVPADMEQPSDAQSEAHSVEWGTMNSGGAIDTEALPVAFTVEQTIPKPTREDVAKMVGDPVNWLDGIVVDAPGVYEVSTTMSKEYIPAIGDIIQLQYPNGEPGKQRFEVTNSYPSEAVEGGYDYRLWTVPESKEEEAKPSWYLAGSEMKLIRSEDQSLPYSGEEEQSSNTSGEQEVAKATQRAEPYIPEAGDHIFWGEKSEHFGVVTDLKCFDKGKFWATQFEDGKVWLLDPAKVEINLDSKKSDRNPPFNGGPV